MFFFSSTAPWPEYSTAANANNVMQILRNNITAIPDSTYRAHFGSRLGTNERIYLAWDIDKTDFLNTQKVLDEFQK